MRYYINDEGVYLHAEDLELQLRRSAEDYEGDRKKFLNGIAWAIKEFAKFCNK